MRLRSLLALIFSSMPNGAIGNISDFKNADGSLDQARLEGKVIDGPTGFVFDSMEAWEAHISPASGTTPTDAEYLRKTTTPNYDEIAGAALARGAGQETPIAVA